MNQKRILIFGVGAVGSVFGVKLAKAGNDVYFYAKEHQRKKLREIDLKIQKLKEIFDNAGIQAKISKDIFFEISSFLAILIPLTAIAILAKSSGMNFIKEGVKATKEVFKIVHEKYKKTSLLEVFFSGIPEFLLVGFIWLAVLLTKSISGLLIENYSKAMKEQTELILNGFISESKKYKVNCYAINNILQEINKVTKLI